MGSQVNKDRQHYVTQEETDHLINACNSPKQRLIVALGRYAGLRIPSELTGLLWSEVNWERGRFLVHSPKTEGKGKSQRIVPIFTYLYPYLSDAFEVAPVGIDRIFPEIHEIKSMGSFISKLATRAGITLWEKPFVNMRASCATDLADTFPSHICAEWLGHTEQIADKHYRQVTESHFEKAIHDRPCAAKLAANSIVQNSKHNATLIKNAINSRTCDLLNNNQTSLTGLEPETFGFGGRIVYF